MVSNWGVLTLSAGQALVDLGNRAAGLHPIWYKRQSTQLKPPHHRKASFCSADPETVAMPFATPQQLVDE